MPQLINAKRERFCQEYIVDLNATKSAIRAGYSIGTARQTGYRLLTNVDIETRIAELQNERSERLQITQDQVIQELAAIAFGSIGDVAEWHQGGLKLKAEISPAVLKSFEIIKTGDNGFRIKCLNKLQALYLLGKHLGLFGAKRQERREPMPPPAPATYQGL